MPPSIDKQEKDTTKRQEKHDKNPFIKQLKTSSSAVKDSSANTRKVAKRATIGAIKQIYPQSLSTLIEKVTTLDEVPKQNKVPVQIMPGDEYYKFKKEIIEEMVSKRIYKDDDLSGLYKRISAKHVDLDREKLDAIWQEIIDDLNE